MFMIIEYYNTPLGMTNVYVLDAVVVSCSCMGFSTKIVVLLFQLAGYGL